jgi:hypothetical protein
MVRCGPCPLSQCETRPPRRLRKTSGWGEGLVICRHLSVCKLFRYTHLAGFRPLTEIVATAIAHNSLDFFVQPYTEINVICKRSHIRSFVDIGKGISLTYQTCALFCIDRSPPLLCLRRKQPGLRRISGHTEKKVRVDRYPKT